MRLKCLATNCVRKYRSSGACGRYVDASYCTASALPTSSIRTTSGLTFAYLASVRKFKASRPRARRETRSSAIFKYVFITSAEPYSSTNCRFAFSSVFEFRSATAVDMAHLPERMEMQDAGDYPHDPDAEAQQRGSGYCEQEIACERPTRRCV